MAGIDYRQIQAPEGVDMSLPDNGAAQRAEALRQTFKEFASATGNVASELETHAGAMAGAAAGATGNPQYKEGLARITAYGRAYNNAATGAYAVQAEAQADDAAARLRVQANNDPEAFRATYSAVRDGVLKTAPREAVPMLTELYNKRLAAGLAALSGDQAAEQQQLQRKTYDEGVARQTSRVAILQGSENAHDQLAAQDEQVKLNLLIDGGVNSGLYSRAEAEAMHINAARAITAQVFETNVDRELAKPDGDVIGLLERFRDAHLANVSNTDAPPVLSEDEFQKLMGNATTKIREWNLTQAMARRDGKTEQEQRYAEGDTKYTGLLLQGQLTEKALADAVYTQNLKPERATALRSQLLQGDAQVKNPRALFELTHNPGFLGMSDADIASYPGITWQDALTAARQRDQRNNTWENSQSAKDARARISAALTIKDGLPAAAHSELEQNAVRNALVDFTGRISKLPPQEREHAMDGVASDVIADIKKAETQEQITSLQTSRARIVQQHGPGSADEWNSDKLNARIKAYDDQILQLQRQVQGK